MRIETLETGVLKISRWHTLDDKKNSVLLFWERDKDKSTGLLRIVKDGLSSPEKQNDVPASDLIRRMRVPLQRELQNAINERSELTEEELQGLEF